MATFQKRGDTWRAIVRRKGHKPKSATFPTKGLAKVWADRIELELAEADARGTVGAGMTIAELVDWYRRDVGRLKRVSKTQAGNLTRIREGLGTVVAAKLTVAQIVERFALPIKLVHLVLIDGNFVPPGERAARVLKDGDTLAIWPPVAGG